MYSVIYIIERESSHVRLRRRTTIRPILRHIVQANAPFHFLIQLRCVKIFVCNVAASQPKCASQLPYQWILREPVERHNRALYPEVDVMADQEFLVFENDCNPYNAVDEPLVLAGDLKLICNCLC